MSYDLYLRDPVTREVLEVPGHMMFGGNIPCDYVNGNFVPKPTTDAYLNITYNYSRYYYGAFSGPDTDDPKELSQHKKDCDTYGIDPQYGGIEVLNGISGADAVPILQEMIRRIEEQYKNKDGTWIITQRERTIVTDRKTGKREHEPVLLLYLDLKRQYHSEEETQKALNEKYEFHKERYEQDEGYTGNYWELTAANAIKPLYQLIALSKLRPDGVLSEES